MDLTVSYDILEFIMYILFRLHTISTSIRCRMQDKNIFKMLQSSYAVHSSRESESEYVISTLCLYHTRRLKAPCSSKLVKIKMTPCSKASTQEHRRKFLSPQQYIYERNIQERYVKQQTKIGLGFTEKKSIYIYKYGYWRVKSMGFFLNKVCIYI